MESNNKSQAVKIELIINEQKKIQTFQREKYDTENLVNKYIII